MMGSNKLRYIVMKKKETQREIDGETDFTYRQTEDE